MALIARPGELIREYRVIRVLAEGGSAIVYLAFDENLQTEVAVKQLLGRFVGDATQVERFQREARTAASLQHPNIVTVRDYFVEDDCPYIVMPYYPLGSTRSLILRLTHQQSANLLIGVLKGLRAADRRHPGLVHRDIKPDNLLRTSEGSVAITDFGIVKVKDAAGQLTAFGFAPGTEKYVAPEIIRGAEATARSDLYSLAVVAYEMLRGVPPFVRSGPAADVVSRKLKERPIPIQVSIRDLDIGIAAWINRQLEGNPRRRYASAAEALEALEAAATVAFGPGWLTEAELPIEEVATSEPVLAPKPEPIRSAFAKPEELAATSGGLPALGVHAAVHWSSLCVAAVLAAAGIRLGTPLLTWSSVLFFGVLTCLRFFDVKVASNLRDVRASGRGWYWSRVIKRPR